MSFHSNRRRGLTLLEMLVVVGIFVILVSFTLLGLDHVRAQARLAKCSSNLHQIDGALHYWSRNNNDRMPEPWDWPLAVVEGAGTDQILYCPDGEGMLSTGGPLPIPTFYTWNGVPLGTNPGGSRDTGKNPWRMKTETISDREIRMVVTYKPNQGDKDTEDCIVTFHRLNGNTWIAVVSAATDGYRTDLVTTDGTRFQNVQAGQVLYLTSAGDVSQYGYNNQAANLIDCNKSAVLVMDYNKLVVDYDGLNSDDDEPAAWLKQRHCKQINVLYGDSSVRLMPVPDLEPATRIYCFSDSIGPSTVLAGITDTGNGNGNGNGNSNGNGNGNGNGKGNGKP